MCPVHSVDPGGNRRTWSHGGQAHVCPTGSFPSRGKKGVQDPSFHDLLEAVGCWALSLKSHPTVFLEKRNETHCYNKAREGHSPGQWPNQVWKQQRPKRYKRASDLPLTATEGSTEESRPLGFYRPLLTPWAHSSSIFGKRMTDTTG